MRKSFAVFGVLATGLVCLSRACIGAIARITEFISVAFVRCVKAVAEVPALPQLAAGQDPVPAIAGYSGPLDVDVRHEAFVHERSAARHC